MPIQVGQQAPDFALKDVDKEGVVRHLTVRQPSEARNPGEYRRALAGL